MRGASAAAALGLSQAAAAATTLSCPPVNYSCEAPSDTLSQAARATVWLRVPDVGQCTGTLINNLRGDGKPYILTARHCAGDASEAELHQRAGAMEIRYGYELPCGGTAATSAGTTYGAIHRAAFADTWLVEALDPPPPAADAWLAGINVDGLDAGATQGVHHGNGQARQYVQQTVLGSTAAYIVSGSQNELLELWSTALERGSTPHGSSGSALFDQRTRVMGILSGGIICAGDPEGNRYSKISQPWIGGYSRETSLKPWLDPDNRGASLIDGAGQRALLQAPPAPRYSAAPASGGGSGGGGAVPGAALLWLALASLWRARRSRSA